MDDDMIYRQAAINALERKKDKNAKGDVGGFYNTIIQNDIDAIMQLPSTQPEPCEYAVSAVAVEEMLKDLLPERGMWEIEGDEAKTAVCETVHDALEGLWKLPLVTFHSNESSLTQTEPLSDAYMKVVWTWLLDYQIKAAGLKGRYTPYEVLSWVANDWRKEHE